MEAKVIADGFGGHRSETLNPLEEADAAYHVNHYAVCLCRRCGQPFLVHQSIYGLPAEFETITDEAVLYPSESKLLPDALPAPVKTAYDQASQCLHASLFEPCVLMSRKCLEAVCRMLKVKGRNLHSCLVNLHKDGHVDSRIIKWAHQIRLVGNEAAHDMDALVTREDARDVLDFTEAILIYVFSLTRRFESFLARRSGTSGPPPPSGTPSRPAGGGPT